MSYTSTPEQDAVIHWQGSQLVVSAFAGTGKTSTLVRFAEENPQSRILYLAYNRAIRDEAEQKFLSNVDCKTSHQLAWPHYGRHLRQRLTAGLRITDVARKIKTQYWPLAQLTLDGLNAFLCSADTQPGILHLPPENNRHGLDAETILDAVQLLWHEMCRSDSAFPVTRDVYLKLFQLSCPELARKWDTLLFDEAQDANPVTSAFILNQPCRIILTGNRHQQIYRFRGADNALDAAGLAQADRLWLTSSFRFGPEVAQMASLLPEGTGEKVKITGCSGEDEVLTQLPAGTPHVAVLSRTISGVIGSALHASMAGKKVYWVGGIEGYRSEELENLYWFSVDMPERMHSPRLSSDHRNFREYCQVAKATGDTEMNQAIRLLDDYFPLPQKLAIMRGQAVTDEKNAQVTVCTAHRSKGLEWPVVMLNDDFFDITDPQLPDAERQDETSLLYVAVTRARRTLVLNELLCMLKDNGGYAPKN